MKEWKTYGTCLLKGEKIFQVTYSAADKMWILCLKCGIVSIFWN